MMTHQQLDEGGACIVNTPSHEGNPPNSPPPSNEASVCNGMLTSNSYLSFSPLGLILSKRSSFFRDLIPSTSDHPPRWRQQQCNKAVPDKEAVHYTFPKPQQVIIFIITQLSRGEARGVICEVVEDRSRWQGGTAASKRSVQNCVVQGLSGL